MSQNHVQLSQVQGLEHITCAFLVSKIIVEGNGVFTDFEIKTAHELINSGVQWNKNTEDFLWIVAGIMQSGANVYDECYAALTFPYKDETQVPHQE